MQESVGKIVATAVFIVIGLFCFHVPLAGRWIGLFVIVGSLGALLTPIVRKGAIWQALAMYAVLFAAVYKLLPALTRIHWH